LPLSSLAGLDFVGIVANHNAFICLTVLCTVVLRAFVVNSFVWLRVALVLLRRTRRTNRRSIIFCLRVALVLLRRARRTSRWPSCSGLIVLSFLVV
jgi:hypothetical protein